MISGRITLLGGLSLAVALLLQGATNAQQADVAEPAAEEQEEMRSIVDLGLFRVRDFRPTRGETVKLVFHMHLALTKSTSQSTFEKLEHWKHRLRNQILIAVRLSLRQDFLEPDLSRFRRIVQLRINQVLKTQLIDEVLLTEFTFTTN